MLLRVIKMLQDSAYGAVEMAATQAQLTNYPFEFNY